MEMSHYKRDQLKIRLPKTWLQLLNWEKYEIPVDYVYSAKEQGGEGLWLLLREKTYTESIKNLKSSCTQESKLDKYVGEDISVAQIAKLHIWVPSKGDDICCIFRSDPLNNSK